MFGMLTSKCRILTQRIASNKRFLKQPSNFNYPELLNDLETKRIDIEQQIKFVKDMMNHDLHDLHLSDSEKTIAFRSTDKLDNRNK